VTAEARIAALFAAERAEVERKRAQHQKIYLWIPGGIAIAAALWILVWMWLKI
jgi:hypothetical protein